MNTLQHLDDYSRQAISKKEVKAKAEQEALTLIESGKDVTPYYVQALRISEYVSTFTNGLKEKVVEEREQYAKNEKVRVLGAEVSVAEAGVRYDYSNCQDREWMKLKMEADRAAQALKDREEFLKSLKAPFPNVLDEESGELYTIYPPQRKSTTAPRIQY